MIKKLFFLLLLFSLLENAVAQTPKVGLVLGGGGAKGFAHIVVLEMLEEMGIPIDLVIGVSSGAIVGGLYSAGCSPKMIKESLLDLDWTSFFQDTPVSRFENEFNADNLLLRYSLEKEKQKKGYSPGQAAYTLFKTLTVKIPSYIDFDTLPIPFRAGVVTIPEGNVELISEGDLAEAIRASIGLPGVFDPFNIDGKLYIDGGTLDNLPIRLAKEMGCDIIIASELFPEPESITTSPLEVPELMLTLYFNVASKGQYHLADTVIKANVKNYSMIDFQKSKEIYSLANTEREKIRENLKKVKEKLTDVRSSGNTGSYHELPYFTPAFLDVTGALKRDKRFIEKYFSKNLKGKILEEKNVEDFINTVYRTGNYRFVALRIVSRENKSGLELMLNQESYEKITFLLGGNYQGVFSGDSINKVSAQSGIYIQGLSGPGSALCFDASWIDVLSFGAMYLQPLSYNAFLTAQADIMLDKHITASGFSWKDAEEERLLLISGEVNAGVFIDKRTTFKTGPFFLIANPQDPPAGGEGRNTAIGFSADFSYNSLDYLFFPTSGVYAELENRFYLPLTYKEPPFFNIVSLDLRGVLPLWSGISIAAGAFAGSDVTLKFSQLDGLPAGFTAFDRQYFFNVSRLDDYYSHKTAASLAFQFQPWENLTILGGQLLFSISASAGELLNEWEDFAFERLIWNTSLNIGVRVKNNFGFLLRIGAGSNGYDPAMPFIALDIGQMPTRKYTKHF